MARATHNKRQNRGHGKGHGKGRGGAPRPDGELRQSQMITTFGPGSLVDLVGDAVLIPGLEHWHYTGAGGYEIHEPRLAENLRRRGLRLSRTNPFRSPPVNASDEHHRGCGIGAVEFPGWFLCPQRKCGRLVHKRDAEYKNGERRHRCQTSDKPSRLVPVRFVTACPNGHLDDFPWNWFAHVDDNGSCSTPELVLTDKGSGDLSDVEVRCVSCGARRSMAKAKGRGALPRCHGKRPWLGAHVGDRSVEEECEEPQRLLLRTASDSYFSQVESALSIPQVSRLPAELVEFFERHHDRDLVTMESLGDVAPARKFIAPLRDAPEAIVRLSHAEVWQALVTYRAEKESDDASAHVRETEYATMIAAPEEQGDSVYAQAKHGGQVDFYADKPRRETCRLPPGIGDLVLLERLREVRALTGFTRLQSESQNIYGEFNLGARRAALSSASDWLPASEIRGEGFLVVLDLDRLHEWEQRPAVVQRERELFDGFVARFPNYKALGMEFQGARFYLLHTLAHLLITQVALTCGYAASAIRERIYCSPKGDASVTPMAGVLLSTGSSGSEGTLGGLVEQGRLVHTHVTEALRRAKLCSHDPVCGRQHPTQGAPGRALLGAACHGCLFIAECSCERSNLYLDRALVVPTLGVDDAEEVAFFPTPAA